MPNEGVTRLIESAWERPDRLAELERFRRNLAIMFTDIKGSTAYFEKYGDAAGLAMVHRCNQSLRGIVEAHNGIVVKTIGDAIMARFEESPMAVRAAIGMQNALTGMNAQKRVEDHILIRIGINYGPVIVRSNNDVFGDAVNVAARLESLAEPEQVIISTSIHEQIAASKEFKTAYLGRYRLKGKSGECDTYEVCWHDKKSSLPSTTYFRVAPLSETPAPTGRYCVIHINKDGSEGDCHEIGLEAVTVGRTDGTLRFPVDNTMASLHSRFSIQEGQLQIEEMSSNSETFVQLTAPYCLQNSDQLIMGRHGFQYRETPLSAELILLKGDTADGQKVVALGSECLILGRTAGSWTFPSDGIMSRAHAKVYRLGDDFFVEDLGSRNGTFLKVSGAAAVPLGAAVLIGNQRFKVKQL